MITEDYVSFEVAKLLKEKGFDADCKKYYTLKMLSNLYYGCEYVRNRDLKDEDDCIAPTLQMTMKWLREKHNYDVGVCLDSYVEPYDNLYYIVIRRRKDKYENISPCEQVYFDTYEEAAEAAIKYCLEKLI